MHIGGVLIFEGPPPRFEDYLDHVRGRLHLVPRYRQKLATPRWRRAGRCGSTTRASTSSTTSATPRCPPPGTEEQLFLLASRIASQQLDRSKPLWENWLVEGLETAASR